MHARDSRGMTALAALVTLVTLPGIASARPRPKVSALVSKNTAPYQRALGAFTRAYDGPVAIHTFDLDDDPVAAVKAEKPTLVLAVGVRAAKAAQALGADVPVIYCMVIDPRANGLSQPQVAGVPLEIPALVQLTELKKLVPQASRVGLVYNPSRSARELEDARAAAAKLNLTVIAEPAASVADFPDALTRLIQKVDALWLVADATVVTQDTFRLMLETAMAKKLPLMVFSDEFVRSGALFSLSPDFEGAGLEAARMAIELAGGKKPAELTAPQPRWNLVVNTSTAQALGLTLSADVLKGAVPVK